MMVPWHTIHRHKSDAAFNQTPGQKGALPESVPTIAVPDSRRFSANIERFSHVTAGHHAERTLVVLVHVVGVPVESTPRLIHLVDKLVAVF